MREFTEEELYVIGFVLSKELGLEMAEDYQLSTASAVSAANIVNEIFGVNLVLSVRGNPVL